jgi:hypothetical protein
MKTLKNLLASLALVGFASVSPLRAADAHQHDHAADASTVETKKDDKAKPYPLDFCVVSDEKFEGSDMKPADLVYEGQTIKFCCKSCVKDFKKDPKKYVAKLAVEIKKMEAAKAKK